MNENKTVHLKDLHIEHRKWTSELQLFADELKTYHHRLEESATKHKEEGREFFRWVEHFQNQFIRQKEVLDQLNHDIHIHEQKLSKYAARHSETLDQDKLRDHDSLREKIKAQEQIFSEIKDKFFSFLVEWK